MGTRNSCAVALFLCFCSVPAFAAFVVDGNTSDWGVTVADNNASTFNFPAGVFSMVEDTSDTAGDSFVLNPHSGGQNFDAEAMGVTIQNNTLFVLIVSGQRPDNGFSRYNPGDLHIVTNLDTYGMEMGGGIGGGTGTTINQGATGSTYTINASTGFTASYADADPSQLAGSIWKNVTWIPTPLTPATPTEFAINGGSTNVGTANYFFTRNTVTSQHSIMELSIPLSVFNGQSVQQISWQPACDNDELSVSLTSVPEPATLLMSLGCIVLLTRGRKNRPICE